MAHLFVCVCSLIALEAHSKPNNTQILRASVSPEFQYGLQYKQLQYIANELGMELSITPMPLARRIHALKQGDIDIMVGLKKNYDTEGKFTYLFPSYEQIETGLFVMRENETPQVNHPDFILGLTIDDNYLLPDEIFEHASKVKVNTLNQKLSLLMNGRIHGFLHLKQRGLTQLQHNGVDEKINVLSMPELKGIEYFIGISNSSDLFKEKDRLINILNDGIKKGEFNRLRRDHYAMVLNSK